MNKYLIFLLILLVGCSSSDHLVISEVPFEDEDLKKNLDRVEFFAKDLEQFWNAKQYGILYDLFSKEFRAEYTKEAFVFLAQKEDERLGILSVKVVNYTDTYINLEIDRTRYKTKTSAKIFKEGDFYYMEPFYVFKLFNPDQVCRRIANEITFLACNLDPKDSKDECEHNTYFSCIYDYALANNQPAFCDQTGFMKKNCFEDFDIKISEPEKIESCSEHFRESAAVACLTDLAYAERNVNYCLAIVYDELRFRCIGKLAAKLDDISICNTYHKKEPYTEMKLMACYTGWAKQTDDDTYCQLIDPDNDPKLGALAEECSEYALGFA